MDFLIAAGVFTVVWFALWLMSALIKMLQKAESPPEIPVRDISKGHHWVYVEAFEPGHYCNVCVTSTFHGAQCDFCGIIADDACMRKADVAISCKSLAIGNGCSIKHHWVNGNLPQRSVCVVCEEFCGDGPGLVDFKCCWCQVSVHQQCMDSYTSLCNLGKWKRMIVPPNCVRLKKVGWKGRRHFVVKEVVRPEIRGWCPLIVVANRKSGNGEGDVVLQSFRRLLNPAQVLDLADVQPETGLEWCHLVPDVQCRVLVAGGDGTVGWILSAVENLNLNPPPQVALLPLGTGNDLSRVLGNDLFKRNVIRLYLTRASGPRLRFIGTVAELRTPLIFLHVAVLSGHNGFFPVAEHPNTDTFTFLENCVTVIFEWLRKRVELYLDGEKQELPELEGIVILNIQSWAAGGRPWEVGNQMENFPWPKQAFNDGLVEVFGLYSSFHTAQVQVGLSEPHRFGQAREVVLKFNKKEKISLPMQVDGEPWLQRPAVITVKHRSRAVMLAGADYEADEETEHPQDNLVFF